MQLHAQIQWNTLQISRHVPATSTKDEACFSTIHLGLSCSRSVPAFAVRTHPHGHDPSLFYLKRMLLASCGGQLQTFISNGGEPSLLDDSCDSSLPPCCLNPTHPFSLRLHPWFASYRSVTQFGRRPPDSNLLFFKFFLVQSAIRFCQGCFLTFFCVLFKVVGNQCFRFFVLIEFVFVLYYAFG